MPRRSKYVYVCPSCGSTTWSPRFEAVPRKFRETTSLVDGRSYPSCRQVEQLCFWCELEKYGHQGDEPLPLPRRAATAGDSQSSMSRSLDAGPLREYSELWALLTSSTHPDGESRLTGSLSLSCDAGHLKLSFQDEETGQYACLMGTELGTLLEEAELRLADGTLPWRPSRYTRKRK